MGSEGIIEALPDRDIRRYESLQMYGIALGMLALALFPLNAFISLFLMAAISISSIILARVMLRGYRM